MNHMFHGFDMDRTMLRIGAMNMMTHEWTILILNTETAFLIRIRDRDMYSLILANPPFKGSLDYDIVSQDLLKVAKTKKTELLFLVLFLKMLKTGGRCACIVPDGVLFGSSKAHKASARNWWKKIVWKRLFLCLPVCLNLCRSLHCYPDLYENRTWRDG